MGTMEPQSRLKGMLLAAQERPTEQIPAVVESLQRLGVNVELKGVDTVEELGPATLVPGVRMKGLVHISKGHIDTFEQERVGPNGKFGKGTYFAAGALTGETYDLLNQPGNVLHGVGFEGSVLFVDRDQVSGLAAKLREQVGVPEPAYKTSIANADITGLLEQSGVPVDAVMIYMDQERTAAEVAVLPAATAQIDVLERTVL